MMKKTLTIALLIAMIIGSCKESTRKEGAEKKNIETIENVSLTNAMGDAWAD